MEWHGQNHIVPVRTEEDALPKARVVLLQRLKQQRVVQAVGWSRDEFYENVE